jgi:hypothetical protein
MSQSATGEAVRDALVQVFSLLDDLFLLPEQELLSRPEYPAAWSLLEHLEHVCLANHFLLLTIAKGCRTALRRVGRVELPETESDLAVLSGIAEPGLFDWTPPAHMVPTGRREAGEIRDELRRQREQSLELLAGMPRGEGRLCSIRISVQQLGRLDMYQWLYFLAQHARYHLKMIKNESKAFRGD